MEYHFYTTMAHTHVKTWYRGKVVGLVGRNVVAMDCEMVGVGPSGTRSVLARVSIVDCEGKVLLDKSLVLIIANYS